MEKVILSLDQVNNIMEQINYGDNRHFIEDQNFYKILVSSILKYIIRHDRIKNDFSLNYSRVIEKQIYTLEEYGIWNWNDTVDILALLYYDDVFIGYVTKLIEDFKPLNELSTYDKGLINQDQIIDLLIKSSRFAKKLHENRISHGDYHKGNILSDGVDVRIIDFDDSCLISKQKKVTYYESPYADISHMNKNLITIFSQNDDLDYSDSIKGDLPKEISDYLKYFEYNNDWLKKGLVRSTMPSEYPHDFLEEFRNYEYVDDCFQKKLILK